MRRMTDDEICEMSALNAEVHGLKVRAQVMEVLNHARERQGEAQAFPCDEFFDAEREIGEKAKRLWQLVKKLREE